MTTKIIVTNVSRLQNKYGPAGFSQIQDAIKALVAADDQRSVQTRVLALDNSASMQKVNASAVANSWDPQQNKIAIDAVYRALKPEYLVLLGAVDVIPYQDLKNPVTGDKLDKDRHAWGDIPYACEAPYSREPADFIGPSRVVGRIPDIHNANDPTYLLKLLKTASTWRSRDPEDYADYLAISAWVWRKSTARSLLHLFGSSDALQISPPKGPRWNRSLLSRRLHFVNCHGSPSDPHFYGQRGKHDYPISHAAWWLPKRLTEGTIVAAECCYGATLYDPDKLHNKQMGICSTYLENGAYGFFGSTTIAYGGFAVNTWADLLCQFFLKRVLAGASLGRAVLEARQQYAASMTDLDPVDLKTLAQFNLLGDPSIHPVRVPTPGADVKIVGATPNAQTRSAFAAYQRSVRRRQLFETGVSIAQNGAAAAERKPMEDGTPAANKMRQLARANKLQRPEFFSFSINRPSNGAGHFRKPTAFKVAMSKAGPTKDGKTPLVLLLGVESKGEIVFVKKGFSR